MALIAGRLKRSFCIWKTRKSRFWAVSLKKGFFLEDFVGTARSSMQHLGSGKEKPVFFEGKMIQKVKHRLGQTRKDLPESLGLDLKKNRVER